MFGRINFTGTLQVDKNKYILKITNCIQFSGKLELPLRGHNETYYFQNHAVVRELVDASLKEHLKMATVFEGTLKRYKMIC